MKVNSCPHKNDLIAYQLGILGQEKQRLLEQHIVSCKECQLAMRVERMIDKELSVRLDPGDIEHTILRKIRVIKEIKITVRPWWQYSLRILLNTLTGFAVGFGIWIMIGGQLNNMSWLTDLMNTTAVRISNDTGMYVGVGFTIAFLSASVLFAFRKSLLKFFTAL